MASPSEESAKRLLRPAQDRSSQGYPVCGLFSTRHRTRLRAQLLSKSSCAMSDGRSFPRRRAGGITGAGAGDAPFEPGVPHPPAGVKRSDFFRKH